MPHSQTRHPSQLSEAELLSECNVRSDRRSGPGGQHRNKVETAVIIVHEPTQIRAEASERRSQAENRRNAIFRLRLALALHHRESTPATQPASELWHNRRHGERISVSATHEDFPALLAELFDYLDAAQFHLPRVAEHFQVSSSQLIRMLRSYPPALALLNAKREEAGEHRLT